MGFSSPPDPKAFNALVWEITRLIPSGKVATYGQIARFIPLPSGMNPRDYQAWSPRWVGAAMSVCPQGVPWQRVINSQGKISLRKGSGPNLQKQLLEDEEVHFDERERVDLKTFGWEGPSPEWLAAKNRSGLKEGCKI